MRREAKRATLRRTFFLGFYLLGPGVRLYEEFVVDDGGVGDVFL
jgi:hypothetical protein